MAPSSAPVNNFYALLEDNSVRKVILTQNITNKIRDVFIGLGEKFLNDNIEQIEFDGNYIIDEDEILFVAMDLEDNIKEVATNSIGINELDISSDKVKSLFWFENNTYYFQNFDNRKILRNKNVLYYHNNSYTLLEENAFIIDNIVTSIYLNGKYYFRSYANANRIFSLISFYKEATNEEVKTFASNGNISLDEQWFLDNVSTLIRKQITLIQKSQIL